MGMSMIDINKLCLGCMREKKTAGGACPYCGFDLSAYQSNPRCLPPNTILAGKYLVGRVLGQGGFGITYMGFDLNMETRVAIKEYFPVELVSRDTTSMTGDRVLSLSGEKSRTYQQGLEKYVTEARNVSRFSDISGVVSVKDFFYENETAYIVMEYIEGESLKDYLAERGGSLPEAEALAILRPVLDALSKIHTAGIIHRDISPDNIMLTFKEEAESDLSSGAAGAAETGKRIGRRIESVKLIDFGAARMTAKNDQKSLTIILKHGYAPEEQYRTHGEQGSWTDVYAISAVLYRMLTGETPVSAMDRMFQDSLKGFDAFPVKVSKGTATADLKGLAVKKEDRIQSIAELTGALYEGKTVRKNGVKKRGKTVVAIGGVAVCGLLAVGLFFTFGRRQAGQESTSTMQTAEMEQATETLMQEDISAAEDSSGETQTIDLQQEEEDFGEVIVTAVPQTSYAASNTHALILLEDGTVTSMGSNAYGQRNLSEWTRIAAVAAGDTFSAGLRENGTVVIAGQLDGVDDVERWTDIVEIAATGSYVYGLTTEGTIVTNDTRRQAQECLEWSGIRTIAAAGYVLCGLTEDGQVLSTGLEGTSAEIAGWDDVQFLALNQYIVIGVKEDGTAIRANLWTDKNVYGYSDLTMPGLENFQDIVQMTVSYSSCYAVSENGEVYTAGFPLSFRESFHETISGWSGMSGVLINGLSNSHAIGIRKDGEIVETSVNQGNVSVEDMSDLAQVRIYNGLQSQTGSVLGLTKDGTVLCWTSGSFFSDFIVLAQNVSDLGEVGELEYFYSEIDLYEGSYYLDADGYLYMQIPEEEDYAGLSLVNEEPLIQVSSPDNTMANDAAIYVAGVDADGQVHLYQAGVLELPEALYAVEDWTDIVQVACRSGRDDYYNSEILGLRSDGTVVSIDFDGNQSETAAGWSDITGLYAGGYAIGAIRADGTAVFLEDSAEYNYGQYNTYDWTDLTQLAMGLYHTAGLRSDGTVYAVGSNDAGQCEVEDWTDVVYISAGDSCTLGVQSDGTFLIAGDIGW